MTCAVDLVHVPVMKAEILALFAQWAATVGPAGNAVSPAEAAPAHEALPKALVDALVLDATLGAGGHATALLSHYPALRYIAVDADPEALVRASGILAPFASRLRIMPGYFDQVLEACERDEPGLAPDFIFFDLGISMFHLADSNRGFSYARDEPLDMRLSPLAEHSAADLVNSLREEELADLIYKYGEERFSRRIAHAILESRAHAPVRSSKKLADIIWGAVPAAYRRGRIHPATRSFQALRIAVNDELGRAERGILAASRMLKPGGILAVISFHSLEDRIVKTICRSLVRESGWEAMSKKPLAPSQAECAANPPSRSAKLRAVRRPL